MEEQAKQVQDKLYGVEFRNLDTNAGRLVNVVAKDAKEALTKVADKADAQEIVWEVKFLAEVHA